VNEASIIQCGKSPNGVMKVCSKFDKDNRVHPPSVAHTRHSVAADEKMILTELIKSSRVFDYIPGCEHRTFKNIQPSVVEHLDKKKTYEMDTGSEEGYGS